MKSALPRIVVDTREQRSLQFDVPTVVKTLPTGDYSLEGFEDRFCVERKSHTDAYGTIGKGRKRFERELERMAQMERACIVIEANMPEFLRRPQIELWTGEVITTKVDPRMAGGSLISWQVKYGLQVYWCGAGVTEDGMQYTARDLAARTVLRFLIACYKHRVVEKEKRDERLG